METRIYMALGLLLASSVVAPGCNFGTTIPTPFVVGEGPATVGRGRTRLDVGGGGGAGKCCGWGAAGVGGAARVRYGVSERWELGASANVLWMPADTEHGRYPRDIWLSAKLDYKLRLHPFASLLLGAGGGVTPFAPFIGGDIGVVVGRPGRHRWVPYGAVRLLASVPMGAIDRMVVDRENGETARVVPNLSLMAAVGLKVNLSRRVAWVIEAGGGGIFPIGGPGGGLVGGAGGALYGYTGLSFRIGPLHAAR